MGSRQPAGPRPYRPNRKHCPRCGHTHRPSLGKPAVRTEVPSPAALTALGAHVVDAYLNDLADSAAFARMFPFWGTDR